MKRKVLALILSVALVLPSAAAFVAKNRVRAEDSDSTVEDVSEVQIAIDETNFPDETFREYVMKNVDSEEPIGVLTDDEIASRHYMDLDGLGIKTLKGIEYFTELQALYCSSNPISDLNLTANVNLEYVELAHNTEPYNANLSGLSKLEEVEIQNSNIVSLNCTGCVSLERVRANECIFLETLNLSGCTSLDILLCKKDAALTSVNLSGCSALTFMDCYDSTALAELDLTDCVKLDELSCSYCSLAKLTLGNMPKLKTLSCDHNALTSLDVTGCPALEELYCEVNDITELKMNRNPKLKYIRVEGNPVTEIEIYSSPILLDILANCAGPLTGSYSYLGGRLINYMVYNASIGTGGSVLSIWCDQDDVLITEAPIYSVTVTTDGNGTASASITSGPEYTEGTLTAVANEGYAFKEWQVVSGGAKISDVNSATTTFEIGHGNAEIKAVFDVIPTPDPGTPDPSNPGDPAQPQPGKEPSFEDFIERMYVVALNRQSEPEGKAFWMDKVKNEGFTGGRVAIGFLIEAPEFLNRNLNDSDFVDVLYKTFFDRSADEGGKAFWMGHLATDMTREQVVRGFIDSTEWCNLCAYYGVKSGAPNAKAEKPSNNALKFATRLYTECLGREPDADGLLFWALRLTNLESSGAQAAKGFFESKEFQNLNVNDVEYLTRLYRTFMGREPDEGGMTFWLGHLATDMTREQVLKGFAESQEFTNICNQYGIDRGTI